MPFVLLSLLWKFSYVYLRVFGLNFNNFALPINVLKKKKCYYIPSTKIHAFRCALRNISGALALAVGAGAPEVLLKTALLSNRVQGDGIFQIVGLNKV